MRQIAKNQYGAKFTVPVVYMDTDGNTPRCYTIKRQERRFFLILVTCVVVTGKDKSMIKLL